MKKTPDDIDGLYQSFGGDPDSFRELARDEEARAAAQRWPLLASMPPQAEDALPALSTRQKREWRREQPAMPDGAGLSVPPLLTGGHLAAGLRHLAVRGVTAGSEPSVAAPAVPPRTMAKPSPAPVVRAEPAVPSATPEPSRPVRAVRPAPPTVPPSTQPAPERSTPFTDAARPSSGGTKALFGNVRAQAAEPVQERPRSLLFAPRANEPASDQPAAPAPAAGDALPAVFARLKGEEGVRPLASGLFGKPKGRR